MKKHISLFIFAMLFLTACAGSDKSAENAVQSQPAASAGPKLSEAEQLMKSAQFTNEGIKKMFKSAEEMTPVEYEAYLLSYQKCKLEEGKFKGESCPPQNVYFDVNKLKLDQEEKNKVALKLLDSKYESVRVAAARDIQAHPNDTDLHNKVFEFAKKEESIHVVANMTRGFGFSVPKNDEMLTFIMERANNENVRMREIAAGYLSDSDVIAQHPEVFDTLLSLCTQDPVTSVSFYACQGVGRIHDDGLVPALVEVLNDPEQSTRHDHITRALVDMWLNFPRYEYTSKDAYTAYMNYLKKKPRTDAVPAAESLRINQLVDQGDDYKAWQKQAKYFKLKDMISVYSDIAKDDNASLGARKTAIEMINDWGTAKDLKALSKSINSSKVDGIESVQELLKESIENKQ